MKKTESPSTLDRITWAHLMPAPGRLARLFAGAAILATLAGCSDRSPVAPNDTPPAADEYAADPNGTLLRGDPASPAWDSVGNMLPSPAPSNEVIDGFLATRLTGVISAGTTVGELNQVLEDTDVRIVSMTPHSPVVSLVIPAVLGPTEAEALAAQLFATEAFAYAYPVREAQSSVIDEPISGAAAGQASAFASTPSGSALPPHLQLTRMQAAWNAKALAIDNSSLVTVIVPDHYYMDFPIEQIGAQNFPVLGNLDEVDSPYGNLGFIHTGILGANPDAPGSPGAHPLPEELLQIWSLPIAGLSWVEIANLLGGSSLGALISTNFDHLVISSSLDYGDPLFDNVSLAQRAMDALGWRLALTGQVSTGPVFHLTSSGAAVNQTPAAFASPFALQSDSADLLQVVLEFDPDGDPAGLAALQAIWPNLPEEAKSIHGNTAIVGSSTPEGDPSQYSPILSHLRMPGSNVPGPCVSPNLLCVDGVEHASGAGAATPQAAALAAYLWNLSPTLSDLGIFNTVLTAFGGNSTPGFADCYAAVLALDPNLFDPRVRRTILDLDESGQFDHLDLIEYTAAFELETPNMRYDLNGDGTVGGSGSAWFDLDVNGDNPSYSTVTQSIAGGDVSFNETQLTDEEILCYYAYSPLYQGDEEQRDEIMDCGGATVGSVTALTQADVDALEGVVVINGNLSLGTSGVANDISNLDALAQLTSVDDLHVHETQLVNLDGLAGINTVSGGSQGHWIWIQNNDLLTDISGIGAIPYSAPNLFVLDNDQLESVSGLVLTSLDNCTIADNASLTSLVGLASVAVVEKLHIRGNPGLSDLSELEALHTVNDQLQVSGNASLVSLDLELSNSPVLVDIRQNNAMTSLDLGLNGFGTLSILQCPNLTSAEVSGVTAGERLTLALLPALTSLEGLGGIASLEQLYLQSLPLNSIGPLQSIQITASIQIANCNGLNTLAPLSLVGPLTGNLIINECDGLTDLSGLNGVSSCGNLQLTNNVGLIGLTGLGLTQTAGNVDIAGNTCLDPAVVDDFLSGVSVGGTVRTILNGGGNCN